MTYAKPRIPIPFMATLSSHSIHVQNTKNQAPNTFTLLGATYDDNVNCIPFMNGKHLELIPGSTVKRVHHCTGENFETKIPSIRKDEAVQREFILPDNAITFQKALE